MFPKDSLWVYWCGVRDSQHSESQPDEEHKNHNQGVSARQEENEAEQKEPDPNRVSTDEIH